MGIILRTQKMAAGHAAAAFHKHCIKLHYGWFVELGRDRLYAAALGRDIVRRGHENRDFSHRYVRHGDDPLRGDRQSGRTSISAQALELLRELVPGAGKSHLATHEALAVHRL
jgi:hypothetical protein